MAFPSTLGIPYTLNLGWQSAMSIAAQIKTQALSLVTQINQGTISGNLLVGIPAQFYSYTSQLTTIGAVTGMQAYAQAQINIPGENITTDFTNMLNAMSAVSTWITSNFPVDTGGFLQYSSYGANGTIIYATFSSTQLAPLVSLLNTLTNSIN
jgi:hypothetical protein